MPNIAIYQNPVDPSRPSSCTCSCGDFSYGPPVQCFHPQTCVAYCMQMYRGQCTLINTYGCCGSACEYFQSTSLENRYCTCSCAGQQYYNPVDTCSSSQSCLTRCIANFPQACIPVATQACCGQDCLSYSQAVGNACACRCKGNTYYPSPRCISGEGCVATCMTVDSKEKRRVRHHAMLFLFRPTAIAPSIRRKVAAVQDVQPIFRRVHATVAEIFERSRPFHAEAANPV